MKAARCDAIANLKCFWGLGYSGGGKGAKRGIRPDGTVQGAAFGGSKMELRNFAASGKLVFALQTEKFNPLMSRNSLTLPRFWNHTPTVSAPQLHTKQCVGPTPRNLHCWPDWSFTCCKTVQNPYWSVSTWRSQKFSTGGALISDFPSYPHNPLLIYSVPNTLQNISVKCKYGLCARFV